MVKCDKCKKDFQELLYEQNKVVEGVKVTKTFMRCPVCGEQYTIMFDTDATIAKKKQIRKNTVLLSEITNEKEYKRQIKNIEKRKKKLERELKITQSKYAKYF